MIYNERYTKKEEKSMQVITFATESSVKETAKQFIENGRIQCVSCSFSSDMNENESIELDSELNAEAIDKTVNKKAKTIKFDGKKYEIKAEYNPEVVILKGSDTPNGWFKITRLVRVIDEFDKGDIGLVKYRHRGLVQVKYNSSKNCWFEV